VQTQPYFQAAALTVLKIECKMAEEQEGSILGTFLGCLVPLVGMAATLYIEFGGIYHCFESHREKRWLSVFVPPVAWYYALEWPFWHSDGPDEPNPEQSDEFEEDQQQFRKSFRLFGEARIAINSMDQKTAVAKSTLALDAGRSVGTSYLANIDPELPSMFRKKYLLGNELYFSSIDFDENAGPSTNAMNLIIDGRRLLQEWSFWTNNHDEELNFELYGKEVITYPLDPNFHYFTIDIFGQRTDVTKFIAQGNYYPIEPSEESENTFLVYRLGNYQPYEITNIDLRRYSPQLIEHMKNKHKGFTFAKEDIFVQFAYTSLNNGFPLDIFIAEMRGRKEHEPDLFSSVEFTFRFLYPDPDDEKLDELIIFMDE
jgi:hypothetical protein